jgi:hypothetical protein
LVDPVLYGWSSMLCIEDWFYGRAIKADHIRPTLKGCRGGALWGWSYMAVWAEPYKTGYKAGVSS